MSQAFRLSPLVAICTGAALGLILAMVKPKTYIAETTVYFPSINSTQFKQLTQVLKADPDSTDWSKSSPAADAQVVEAACVLFKSRAAVQQALQDAKVMLPASPLVFLGDPIEYLRANDVTTEVVQGTTVKLSVRFNRAEVARSMCQSLLDYYTNFVHSHRLTNTARTREQLERKLERVDKRLTVLEGKLTEASRNGLSRLGDMVIRPDPKTMRELWRKRILEHGSSQRVLEEMKRVRQSSKEDRGKLDTQDDDEEWKRRWGSSAQSGMGLPNNVRRPEIPSRLELERVYEETLLLYHSALLQHDFLSTWESLENFDYELVDPVAVHAEDTSANLGKYAGIGAMLGLMLSLLLGRRPKQD